MLPKWSRRSSESLWMNSFGFVPTPAIVAPIEFTMRRDSYEAMGGHVGHVRPVEALSEVQRVTSIPWTGGASWPLSPPERKVG